MPLSEPIELTGLLLSQGRSLVLRCDEALWRLDVRSVQENLIGRRVRVHGRSIGTDRIAVIRIDPG